MFIYSYLFENIAKILFIGNVNGAIPKLVEIRSSPFILAYDFFILILIPRGDDNQ